MTYSEKLEKKLNSSTFSLLLLYSLTIVFFLTPPENEKYRRLTLELDALERLSNNFNDLKSEYEYHISDTLSKYKRSVGSRYKPTESMLFNHKDGFQELFSVNNTFLPSSISLVHNDEYYLASLGLETSVMDNISHRNFDEENINEIHKQLFKYDQYVVIKSPADDTNFDDSTGINDRVFINDEKGSIQELRMLFKSVDTIYYDIPKYQFFEKNKATMKVPFLTYRVSNNSLSNTFAQLLNEEIYVTFDFILKADTLNVTRGQDKITRYNDLDFVRYTSLSDTIVPPYFNDYQAFIESKLRFDVFYNRHNRHYFETISASLFEIGKMTINEAKAYSASNTYNQSEVKIFGIGFNNKIGIYILPILILLFQLYLLSILNEIRYHNSNDIVNFLFFKRTTFLNELIRGVYLLFIPVLLLFIALNYYVLSITIIFVPLIIVGIILLINTDSLVKELHKRETNMEL